MVHDAVFEHERAQAWRLGCIDELGARAAMGQLIGVDRQGAVVELARRTGVTTSALRYYDELGLVRPTRRVSGHRRYAVDAVVAVGLVRFFQEVGFTLAETKLIATRKLSPEAWRALAVRKSEELRHRIVREEAARQAIEHSLVCPKEDLLDCPNFWATVNQVLTGVELADAHLDHHASAERQPGLSSRSRIGAPSQGPDIGR